MNQDAGYRNIIYTHRVLNYLNASFQGKFAALNILSQFDHPAFSDQDIQTTRDTLLAIRGWMDLLLANRFLLWGLASVTTAAAIWVVNLPGLLGVNLAEAQGTPLVSTCLLVTGAIGTATLALYWLTFFPPVWYRRRFAAAPA